jgi:predicted RNA-binding Zn-ribbon protein involved in translation (DUF1610 family)/Na+-transporting methylmalonyl-CoA/oxaloacetate decarboxylase gamma subunit
LKKYQVDLDQLPDGVYYYCANCERWFGRWEPASHYQCPDCGWRWENARGTFTTSTKIRRVELPPQPVEGKKADSGCRLITVWTLLLAGSCLAYFLLRPTVSKAWLKFKIAWSNFIEGTIAWLEFIGSILLNIGALSGATLLLFGLFFALIFLFLLVIRFLASVVSTEKHPKPIWDQTRETLNRRGRLRLIGTFTNLLSSLCALLIVSWIFQRPVDYWDFGFQFVIALIIEIVIFQKS